MKALLGWLFWSTWRTVARGFAFAIARRSIGATILIVALSAGLPRLKGAKLSLSSISNSNERLCLSCMKYPVPTPTYENARIIGRVILQTESVGASGIHVAYTCGECVIDHERLILNWKAETGNKVVKLVKVHPPSR